MTLTAKWVDREREPKCAPNPMFPRGMDVDTSAGAAETCSMEVPYPAKRCGVYMVHCDKCGQTVALTTAGRPDDLRKVTLGCYAQVMDPHPGMTEIVLPDTAKMRRTPHL